MKTKIKKLIVLNALFLFLTSASVFAGMNDMKKENRSVGDFDAISLSISADLYLTQGSKNEVIIEADEDVLEKIITEVNGGELDIRFERWFNYKNYGDIKVYVTVKDIKSLTLAGSGDIISKSPIKSEKLNLEVTGSGKINIDDLNVQKVGAIISGSGDIRIDGNSKADGLRVTVTGSGDFLSDKIEFVNADFTITGSGSIRAFVSGELGATITGSGKIYYKGKPLIDADITGSGKIKKDEY